MGKDKLTYQFSFNYKIVAISTYLKDYRVSFYLNELLDLKLKKIANLIVDNKAEESAQTFELQYYTSEEEAVEYYLIHNKSTGLYFLPTLKQFDFLLILKSENDLNNHDQIIEKLKSSSHFQVIYKVENLTKKENLIVEKNILYTE